LGKLVHVNGNVYEGHWKNDMANGRGVHCHSDGSKYDGEWIDDL